MLLKNKLQHGLQTCRSFLQRQAEQIAEGGLSVLLRKLRRMAGAMRDLFLSLPAVLVVLIVRMLRPLVTVRLGPLRSSRIGHFAMEPEMYLCRRDVGMHGGQRAIDVFYYSTPALICNHQVKKMWERTLSHVLPISWFTYLVVRVNGWLPGSDKHTIPMELVGDTHGLLVRLPSHLSFTPEEEHNARGALSKLGIPQGAPFVCFHARDSSYLTATQPYKDWRYHDYLNVNVNDYLLAAEELTRRGYFVLRMGAVVREALNVENPMIIDYATKARSDLLDIYLCSACQFFLASTTGLTSVPMVFRKPIAWANYISLERICNWDVRGLVIPKKLWLRKEGRFLTFREILASEIGRFSYTEQFEKLSIGIVDNSPEEIRDLALEMDERLKGTWETTEEDEELQRCFWSIFETNGLHRVTSNLRIGAYFLRQHRELLN